MATNRRSRKPVAKSNRDEELSPRDEYRAALADLTGRSDDQGKGKDGERPVTPREEYRAALADLNRYSANNETTEAREARDRFDRADRQRRWWRR